MQRKFIILLVGIIGGIIAVPIITGVMINANNQAGRTLGLTTGLTHFVTPVSVRIEVNSTGNWEGNFTIGTQSGTPSGGAGLYSITGTITASDLILASFMWVSGVAAPEITVKIYICEQLVQSDGTTAILTPIALQQENPMLTVSLFFLVYSNFVLSNPLELI